MPVREHLVLCGNVGARDGSQAPLRLELDEPRRNVRLSITDISRRLVADIPDVLVDLLQVASYVYAADAAVSRGGKTDAQMGSRWRRRFRFIIPVSRPEVWSAVSSPLVETLSFLSEDDYVFEFQQLDARRNVQSYFEFSGANLEGLSTDEVVLFSGGLDSLGGAIEELAAHGKSVALVSHRSSSKIAAAQTRLIDELRQRLPGNRILHVPIWANLDEDLTQEWTHRTRSFLFVALGTVVARLFKVDHIKLFENGLLSLNLPPVAQLVGARASRTTHPKVLGGFRVLISALLGERFDIVNPFVWVTKAEVVAGIAANGFSDLVKETRSCSRVRQMTKHHPHCGLCSQCIDRRFAVIAAGVAHNDAESAYKVELFTGERISGPDREMALAYVRSASDINQMEDVAFFSRYGEISRIVEFFTEPAGTVAEHIFDLHQRHAAAVCNVFDAAISTHAAALREGKLPWSCLLGLVVGRHASAVDAPYPWRAAVEEQTTRIHPTVRIAIDPDRRRVIFDPWGEIKGVGADLLISLARPHKEAMSRDRAPENYPFTATTQLLKDLGIETAETLRRRVLRCRNEIERLARRAGAAPPPIEAVIENNQWHGYRLNPDVVRIVAMTELTPASP